MSDTDTSGIWTEAERRMWRPPERLRPSEWAERYRYLSETQSSRPGRWRNDNAPYLVGIMDIGSIPGVTQVNIQKAAQIGVSEATRNVIACAADQDPAPVGLTLPNKEKGEGIVKNRIIPMFRTTGRLRRLLSRNAWDTKKGEIRLQNGMLIFLMWSGSAASMASNPMRLVVNDEVDKFQPWKGEDASPQANTWVRMRTYEVDRLQYNVSTPTTKVGEIHRLVESSDVKLEYVAPCPHCGHEQKFVWARLKYKKFRDENGDRLSPERQAAVMKSRPDCVWYECEKCSGKIRESDKPGVMSQGHWTTESGVVRGRDGEAYGDALDVPAYPRDTHVGMVASALCCLWVPWLDIAVEHVKAMAYGGGQLRYDFDTQTLGIPHERRLSRAGAEVFAERSQMARLSEGVAPAWTFGIITTIDTQKDHFKYVVRAWGVTDRDENGVVYLRSQRVMHGRLERFADLDGLLAKKWPVAGKKWPPVPTGCAMIDTGGTASVEVEDESRTAQVYRWGLRYASNDFLRLIKGTDRRRGDQNIWKARNAVLSVPGQRDRDVPLWLVRTHYWEDQLANAIWCGKREGDERPMLWLLNKHDDHEYNQELSNRQKIVEIRRGREEYVWVPTAPGAAYDYRHCEVYQFAAAWARLMPALLGLTGTGELPDAKAFGRWKQKSLDAAERERKRKRSGGDEKKRDRWSVDSW